MQHFIAISADHYPVLWHEMLSLCAAPVFVTFFYSESQQQSQMFLYSHTSLLNSQGHSRALEVTVYVYRLQAQLVMCPAEMGINYYCSILILIFRFGVFFF